MTIRIARRKKTLVRSDLIIKIYRTLAKKRYLKGKHTYEYERIWVPIPGRLHDIVRPFLNQRLKISITGQNNGLTITLHRVKTFLHTEKTPQKSPKNPTKN